MLSLKTTHPTLVQYDPYIDPSMMDTLLSKDSSWYMDVIRYNLNDDQKRVKSGLAWHCENDNYPNVITVLHYLRLDEGLVDGNLRYKDNKGTKCVLPIVSGTTVIMDGQVPHKPQDPYGSGIRDVVIVSFVKM